jgi:hypothetical protein
MSNFTNDDDALLAELGVEVEVRKTASRTPREERIIAGFEEIQRFVEENGHAPRNGDDRDIFERLYAVRLDRICGLEECRALIEPLDHQGLLSEQASAVASASDAIDDDALLAELGVGDVPAGIQELRHVRPSAEKRAAEGVATRQRCADFDRFKPVFEAVQKELAAGIRETRPFELKADIEAGRFFIVGGQKAYVVEKGEEFTNPQGRRDARLRVIFDNGTESSLLMRSLQRALNEDDAGRRITDSTVGPLFTDQSAEGDEASGTIYVLRSNSNLPTISASRNLIHKIGVTNLAVEKRIAGARLQPTFLMADVEIVARYELYNINRAKLENLIHHIFTPARLEIEIQDRFGNPVVPREWFLVPLKVIDEAVDRIKDGTIRDFVYDPAQAGLVSRT